MPPNHRLYTLTEIASIAGVTPRTVRYYVSQGLLPAPGEQGRGPHYDDRHLDRLRLIRELQKRHQPLAEIRRRLGSMSDDQLSDALDSLAETSSPGSDAAPASALEYIRSVLGERGSSPGNPDRSAHPGPPIVPPPTRLTGASTQRRPLALHAASGLEPSPALESRTMASLRHSRFEPVGQAEALAPGTETPGLPDAFVPVSPGVGPAAGAESSPATRSQWDRISLTPDIELHVRRPLSRLDNRRVERLITIARQVLQEGQP